MKEVTKITKMIVSLKMISMMKEKLMKNILKAKKKAITKISVFKWEIIKVL